MMCELMKSCWNFNQRLRKKEKKNYLIALQSHWLEEETDEFSNNSN
jgi:hypothetical protein